MELPKLLFLLILCHLRHSKGNDNDFQVILTDDQIQKIAEILRKNEVSKEEI